MERLEFKTEIKAPVSVIWKVLWDDKTYREWTGVFCEGTYAVSNWNEGDSIHFLTPSGEGMDSIIDRKIENQYMAFKHIGELKNFEPQPINETTKEWSGSMEIYELISNDDSITLKVYVDILEKYKDYFLDAFPKGLERVKQLSENN